MQQQNDHTPSSQPSLPPKSRRRFLTGVLTGGLLGSLLVGSLNVFSHPASQSGGWWRGHGSWGSHRHGQRHFDMSGAHMAFATDWVLTRIEATDEQRQRVNAILQEALQDLAPVKDQHQQHRQTFLDLLGQATIDRDALQNVRSAEVALLETASQRLLGAIADVAEVLTPAQRAELLTFAAQCRH